MKVIIVLVSILVTGAFSYLGNQIAVLNSQVSALKALKAALTTEKQKLTNKNKKLVAQQNATKQAVRDNRKRVAKRSLSRASKKIAKAGGAMIPFAGITVVAAATADDIHDLCTDIEDARKLEEMVLEEKGPPISAQQEKYCYDNIGEEITEVAGEAREAISRTFDISYEEMWRQGAELMKQMDAGTEAMLNTPYQQGFEKQYRNAIRYWSELMKEIIGNPEATPTKKPPTLDAAGRFWGKNLYELVHDE